MTYNLNMNNYKIINLKDTTSSSGDSEAVNKKYVDAEINKVDLAPYLKKDGSAAMTGDLNLGGNKIKNLATPAAFENDRAVNVSFFNTHINASNQNITRQYKDYIAKSHIVSSHKKNAFLYLRDVDESSSENNITVNGVVDFSGSPHEYKKAYSAVLTKDSGTNNYRSRIGFNLNPLPLGTYTMIFEFFPPEMINIQLSASATRAYINKTVQRDFNNYSKLLVQINNNSKQGIDYIYIDLHGTATSTPVNVHMIVYGVKDWMDSVDPSVYNLELFVNDNGEMKMQTDINMDTHRIENVGSPINNTDASNKLYVDRTLRIDTTLLGVPILENLTLGLIPSLTLLDVDENDKIAGMTDPVNNRKFTQSVDSRKPLLKFDTRLGKYHAYFDGADDFLLFNSFPSTDIGGSSRNTSTTFLLVNTHNQQSQSHFRWGSNNRFGAHIPFSNGIVYVDWGAPQVGRLTKTGLSNLTGKIELWTIRVTNDHNTSHTMLDLFRGTAGVSPIASARITGLLQSGSQTFSIGG